ncbi:H(+)/Cl(-) exchange transporter 7 [Galdieria sulphuraria]|nr:H(+)/Cl(-) exchange transporter 7 [Galdieria sulphuraria]
MSFSRTTPLNNPKRWRVVIERNVLVLSMSSNAQVTEDILEVTPEFRLLESSFFSNLYNYVRSSIQSMRSRSSFRSHTDMNPSTSVQVEVARTSFSSLSSYQTEENYSSELRPRLRRTDIYDCVEFHTPASLVNVRWAFPRSPREQQFFAALHLFLAVLTGILVGVFALSIEQGVRAIYLASYKVTQNILIEELDSFWGALIYFVGFSSCIALTATCLVLFVSPEAVGSGIPPLKGYINGIQSQRLLSFRTFVAKLFGNMFVVGSGLISGSVAPVSHIGAITGAGLSQGVFAGLNIRLNWKWFRFYRTEAWKRDFASIGLGAGFAAALEAPLGGMFFSIEMSNAHWHYRLAWIALLGGIIATFTMGTLTRLSKGNTLIVLEFAEYGSLVSAGMQMYTFMMHTLPFVLLLGVLGGCLGGIAVAIMKQLTLFRKRYIIKWYHKLLEMLLVNMIINILRFLLPYWGGQCQSSNHFVIIPEQTGVKSFKYRDYSRFFCTSSEFNDWAALIYNPLETVLDYLFHSSDVTLLPIGGLFVGLIYYYVFLLFSAGLYAPVGVFIPSFTIGGFIGRLVGKLASLGYPGSPGLDSSVLQASFAVIGSAAFGSGFLRVPMTISLGLLDATQDIRAAFCSLTASVIARNIGEIFSEGFFDSQVNLSGMPFLDATITDPHLFHSVRARDVMQRQMATIHLKPRVGDVVLLLQTVEHGAFPVVAPTEVATTPYIAEYARSSKSSDRPSRTMPQNDEDISPHSESNDWRQVEQVNQPARGVVGTISRHILLQLLRLRHYSILNDSATTPHTSSVLPWLSISQLDEAWPNITDKEAERVVLEHYLGGMPTSVVNATLDLEPYMNPNPFIVSEWSTAADLRAGFRQMGARHILVARSGTGVIDGICTRKDIMPSVLRQIAEQKRRSNH